MRVLVVEDEPYMAEAIRDGLRLEAIAADIAGDGDTALELLRSVSDSLCAGIFTDRYRKFIRYRYLALSEVLLPGLFSGFPEPVIPCPAWPDAACSYFPGGSGASAA